MIADTINAILAAEEEVNQLVSQATEDAKAMVADASLECEKIRNTAKEAVKEERKKVVELASKEGDKQYKDILSSGKNAVDKLKKSTEKTQAVEFIKQKVLAGYGNS